MLLLKLIIKVYVWLITSWQSWYLNNLIIFVLSSQSPLKTCIKVNTDLAIENKLGILCPLPPLASGYVVLHAFWSAVELRFFILIRDMNTNRLGGEPCLTRTDRNILIILLTLNGKSNVFLYIWACIPSE